MDPSHISCTVRVLCHKKSAACASSKQFPHLSKQNWPVFDSSNYVSETGITVQAVDKGQGIKVTGEEETRESGVTPGREHLTARERAGGHGVRECWHMSEGVKPVSEVSMMVRTPAPLCQPGG